MTDTSGADTVDPAATDRRGLRVLGFEECLQRLHDAPVGRVGFLRDGEVAILPVNHVVDGMDVAFRTSWGSKLQTAADAGRVAFEVDGHDTAARDRLERPGPRQRDDRLRGGGPAAPRRPRHQTVGPVGRQHVLGPDPPRGDHRPRDHRVRAPLTRRQSGARPRSTPEERAPQTRGAACPTTGAPSRVRRSSARSAAGQDDLQGAGLAGAREHVVGLDELVQGEVVGDEPAGVDLAAGDQRAAGSAWSRCRPGRW